MKKIEVVFPKERLANVEEALREQGYPEVTIYQVGSGGKEIGSDAASRLKLEVVVMNDHVYRVSSAITKTTGTADVEKDKVFVSSVDSV